jgi:hypothetical protein
VIFHCRIKNSACLCYVRWFYPEFRDTRKEDPLKTAYYPDLAADPVIRLLLAAFPTGQRLGHSSVTTTAHYPHSFFGDKMAAVMQLEREQKQEGREGQAGQESVRPRGRPAPNRPRAPVIQVRVRLGKPRSCNKIGP